MHVRVVIAQTIKRSFRQKPRQLLGRKCAIDASLYNTYPSPDSLMTLYIAKAKLSVMNLAWKINGFYSKVTYYLRYVSTVVM
jgi:hypothetical protein